MIDGQSLSWEEFGELMSAYAGWSFRLTLGEDATIASEDRGVRALAVDRCAKLMIQRQPPRWFVIDLGHYPTPGDWRARLSRDAPRSRG